MFQKGKIKDNKIFCDTIDQDTGFEPGPLDLQPDALSAELSGLGGKSCQSLEFMSQKRKLKDNKIIGDNI